jgi:hypothetical protein
MTDAEVREYYEWCWGPLYQSLPSGVRSRLRRYTDDQLQRETTILAHNSRVGSQELFPSVCRSFIMQQALGELRHPLALSLQRVPGFGIKRSRLGALLLCDQMLASSPATPKDVLLNHPGLLLTESQEEVRGRHRSALSRKNVIALREWWIEELEGE